MSIVQCARPNCSAGITWVRTANGRPMPLDPEPNPRGNVVLDGGLAKVAPAEAACRAAIGEPVYMPHWATCADPPPRKAKKAKR